MTLLARDEEEILDAHLRYHFEQGVDFVVATDHLSEDGTSDILREYERDGVLHVIREEREEYNQPLYVTRMARLAATDFGADWVINADADEFWWPRDASFRDLFDAVPTRFGVVQGLWRHFVLRPDDDGPFFERMLWRRRPSPDPLDPYHLAVKVAHRAHPGVVVLGGNHKARVPGLETLTDWIPIEVLHFSIRTTAHATQKFTKTSVEGPVRPGRHWQRAVREIESLGDRFVATMLVDDDALARGLDEGSLTRDTRVRDALRCAFARMPHEPPAPAVADDVELAAEFGEFRPAASITRLAARVSRLEARAAAVERAALVRLS